MKEFFDCLFTTNGMAFGTGVLIFLITLFLVSRRVIGFTLALLLLLVALGASFAVANQDKIHAYFDSLDKGKKEDTKTNDSTTKEEPKKDENTFSEKLDKVYHDLKDEYEILKDKIQGTPEEKKD